MLEEIANNTVREMNSPGQERHAEFHPQVGAHPVFEFRRDGLIPAEAGSLPKRLLGLGNFYDCRFVPPLDL
jgi:hypothetical protein